MDMQTDSVDFVVEIFPLELTITVHKKKKKKIGKKCYQYSCCSSSKQSMTNSVTLATKHGAAL